MILQKAQLFAIHPLVGQEERTSASTETIGKEEKCEFVKTKNSRADIHVIDFQEA